MPTWNRFVSASKVIEVLPASNVGDSGNGGNGSSGDGSLFGGIWGYVELWFPWPLANRAMVVRCEVVDVLGSCGAILVRLLSGDYRDPAKLPTTPQSCPRLHAQNLTAILPLPPKPDGTPRTR